MRMAVGCTAVYVRLLFPVLVFPAPAPKSRMKSSKLIINQKVAFVTFNPLMGTLKQQSNGPLYSNTVIGTLAVDGWDIWNNEEGPGYSCSSAQSPPRCTTCNSTYHQRLVYEVYIIRYGTRITFAL